MDQEKMTTHYQGSQEHVSTHQGNPPPYTPNPVPRPHTPGPYQPGPYNPGPYGPTVVQPTVVQATVVPGVVPVLVGQQIGPNPARMTCKSCHFEIVTRTESRPTFRTHLCAAILCILLWWPCVCIPYCMGSCMNTDHYCPNCNAYIGSYNM